MLNKKDTGLENLIYVFEFFWAQKKSQIFESYIQKTSNNFATIHHKKIL